MPIPSRAFYLMRHGQTTDNALGLISGGGSDPFLTLKGHKQAEIAALRIRALDPAPSRIVSSPLRRALLTARALSGAVPLSIDPRLAERHLGPLDGKISEAEQKSRGALPEEESADAHRRRVLEALNAHLAEEGGTLFVCHAGTIRRICETLRLAPRVGNAEILRLAPGGEGRESWTLGVA
jgi:broad specificity phosphatase PhoE